MTTYITMDGVQYDLGVVSDSLKRSAKIIEGKAAGTAKDGSYIRDVLGTKYNYSFSIQRRPGGDAEYDTFYAAVTAPVNGSHQITVPFGQTTLTFDAYITGAEDVLRWDLNGVQQWGNLTVTFMATAPQIVPS